MSEFTIITDSSCDLPHELADELGLIAMPLSVMLDGKEYFNHLSLEGIDMSAFFARLRSKASASTSAANHAAAVRVMEGPLSEGKDVLFLSFSSGLSNTANVTAAAAAEMAQKYPERKVFAVDTLCASLGQGLLVYLTCLKKREGWDIERTRDYCVGLRQKIRHCFTVDDLMHLHRGGRVSTATALMGSALNIKPVMRVDEQGRLEKVGTVKGRKAAINSLFDSMMKHAVNPGEQVMFICHGDCMKDALALKALVEPHAKQVIINYVGPVIGAHSGPGTLGLFFLAEHR